MGLPFRLMVQAIVTAALLSFVLATGTSASGARTARQKLGPGVLAAADATAYCQAGITRSGVDTHMGIAAADPAVLPVGSVIRVKASDARYSGIYTVLDTGRKVLGRTIDLFMHDCREATKFGRQGVLIVVLRHGWDPRESASAPVSFSGQE